MIGQALAKIGLGAAAIMSVVSVGLFIKVLMLEKTILEQDGDIRVLKANEATLKGSIEEQKATIATTAGLLSAQQETTNALITANQESQTAYIEVLDENRELSHKLDQQIRNAPTLAARSANDRTQRLLDTFFRPRRAYRDQTTDLPSREPTGTGSGDGKSSEGAQAGSDQ